MSTILKTAAAFLIYSCLAGALTAAQAETTKSITIPAGELNGALESLVQQTGIQLLYDLKQVEGLRTQGVSGAETPQAAVSALLKGTTLTTKTDESGAILISAVNKSVRASADISQVADLQLAQPESESMKKIESSENAENQKTKTDSSAEESGNKIEEIVVTAQRREERLLDTPISMGVLSGEDLDQGTQRALVDALSQVGGVSITEPQPGRTVITIRGVVAGPVFSSSAALYMDEVPFALPRISELPDVNAYDLARVEVLRGPQGTLFGASSLSGAVRVIPNYADVHDFEFKGRIRLSGTDGSSEENYGADLAVNVPLIPGSLALRGVVGYSEYGGFINSNFDGTRDINDTESENYRLSATWLPVNDLEVRLGVSRSEITSNATSLSLDNYSTFATADQPGERTLDIYSLVAEYDWGGVSLLSSTSYVDYIASDKRDRSLGSSILTFLNVEETNQVSQEFRLVSDLDGPWQWSAGAFYLKAERLFSQDARPFPGLTGVGIEGITNESYAVFGELTRSFADGRFDITGGLRLYQAEETLQDLGSITNAPLIGTRVVDYKQPTGRVVLNYHASDDVLVYGSVGTGFRNGAIQGAEILVRDPNLPNSDPDTLLSYEVGSKAQLNFGAFGNLTYDVAVYYLDWRDIQQLIGVSTPAVPAGLAGRVNVGTASGFGIDAGLTYNPNNAVALWTSVGWNDLTFDESVTTFVSGAPHVLFAEGERPNDSPEWTAAAGIDIRTPTAMDGIDLAVSGDVTYGSERGFRALSGGVLRVTFSDPITRANFGIGLASDVWTARLFVDNAFDEDGAMSPRQVNGRLEAPRARPRTIGIQFTFNH